jgi:hypothetical protein
MCAPRPIIWAAVLLMPLILLSNQSAFGVVDDDYAPEVTARVVRISVLRGDVQIRRGGEDQIWEKATPNLPIVEGDELTTGADSRVEIQLDKDGYVRLSDFTTLKFTTLRDEGVALSVPQGTMSLRVLNFEKSRNYYEIDAPSTTISVERAGMYRAIPMDPKSVSQSPKVARRASTLRIPAFRCATVGPRNFFLRVTSPVNGKRAKHRVMRMSLTAGSWNAKLPLPNAFASPITTVTMTATFTVPKT